jgi:hypothetical protein
MMEYQIKPEHPLYPLIKQLVDFKKGMKRIKEKDYLPKKVENILERSGLELSESQLDSLRTAISQELVKDEKMMSCIIKFHKANGLAGGFLEWVMECPGVIRLNKNYDSNESNEDKIIDAFIMKDDAMIRVQLKGMKMEERDDGNDYGGQITGKRNTQFIDKKTKVFDFENFVYKLNDDYEILDYEVVFWRFYDEKKDEWQYLVVAVDTKKLMVEKSKFEFRKTRMDNMRYEYDYCPEVCKLVCNTSASSQIAKQVTSVCGFIKLFDAEILYCDEGLEKITK